MVIRSNSRPRASIALAAIAAWFGSVQTLAGLAFAQAPAPASPSEWTYVAESTEPGFDRAPLQKVTLADQLPENTAEADEVMYRGTKRKYGLVRYGSPNSTRVAVVVDERDGGEFDLYVDRNRNRVIEPKERIEGTGPLRKVALPSEVVHDEVAVHIPRQVVFRRGTLDGGLSFASTGYLAGQVELEGRKVAVRRVDGDANGFFADSRDRLWLDLDGNGVWDPFTEQFPLAPLFTLKEQRYAVRSDAIGNRLTFEAITGLGTLALKLATLPPGTEVGEIELMFVGEDGSAFTIRGADEEVQVPIGRYAAHTLSLTVTRAGEPFPWHFVFSRQDAPEERHWHTVAKDARVLVDPVGKLEFTFAFPGGTEQLVPGKSLSLAPRLFTHEGLLINSCGRDRGRTNYDNAAEIELRSAAGTLLDTHRSGFA